jgi:hypothetical protein
MDNEFTKDQFAEIMELSEKIEDLVEGNRFFYLRPSHCSGYCAGQSRSALTKHRQEFSKDDFIGLFANKMDYWWDFYDYLDEVKQ